MHHRLGIRSLISTALLCTAAATLAAEPPAERPHAGHSMGSGSSSAAAAAGGESVSMQMHQVMMEGMKDMRSMQQTGDADRDFATMMKHHHAQAVKMTQAYLKGARDPKLKAWAQKSLNSQRRELQELQSLDVANASAQQDEPQR